MICQSCERDIFRSCALSLKGKTVNCLGYCCDRPEKCKGLDIREGIKDMESRIMKRLKEEYKKEKK